MALTLRRRTLVLAGLVVAAVVVGPHIRQRPSPVTRADSLNGLQARMSELRRANQQRELWNHEHGLNPLWRQ